MTPRNLRKATSLTQAELAAAFGMTLRGWQKTEQYDRRLRPELELDDDNLILLLKRASNQGCRLSAVLNDALVLYFFEEYENKT